ncbi:uncharacterized protein PAC_16835 [Phialocephala subalpina]|uniref:Transcription factor domain-containing protein n=1 Tax=Phialocephala subalpina TaxID=576137 RepID=A0A1L7XPI6_9HELO|nr:uncharacterized protein PAC_16835 [Phialocephala subalpina]
MVCIRTSLVFVFYILSFAELLDLIGQLHSLQDAVPALWTLSSHQVPRQLQICPHEAGGFCSDCEASSPGSVPSGIDGSSSIPRIAMSNGDGQPSRQETPRADWRRRLSIGDSNSTGAFGLQTTFDIDDNGFSYNDSLDVSGSPTPLFQFGVHHSLAHHPFYQSGDVFTGESAFQPDWSTQNGPSAVDSLDPHSVEHALSPVVTTLFDSSRLNVGIDVGQIDYPLIGDFPLGQFTYGSDTHYPSHLDLVIDSAENTPPVFEGISDEGGVFLSAPQTGSNSPAGNLGSPNILDPSQTISQAGGSNPRRSSRSPKSAVPAIRWASPESSEHSQMTDPNEKRRGRRKGHFQPSKRAQCVADMDGICNRCKRGNESTRLFPDFEICSRARLQDYIKILFPRALKGHLEMTQVNQLINKYDKCFTENTMQAQFSCDRDYPPLVLEITEFVPPLGERATAAVIPSHVQQGVTFEQRFPATLALSKLEDNLQQKCSDHIKEMVRYHCDNEQVFPMRYSSEISIRVFAAVCKFHRGITTSGDPALLNKAMMLYAGYRFMNTGIRYTHTSFSALVGSIKNPPIQNITSRLVSRLLNRQLKYAVNEVMKRETASLLEELQRELYSKKKSAWATTFCVILILCICMEEVQTAMEGLVLHLREHPGSATADEDEAIAVCRRLDDLPFAHMCELFHMAFKTHKIGDMSLGKRKRKSSTTGFNPLKGEMIERNESDGFGKEAVELIGEIRTIMKELDSHIKAASETPDFRSGAECFDSHLKFMMRNSGRLIATFLRSFEHRI